MSDARAAIARRLRRQARLCRQLGSPLYAALLEEAAADTERGGPTRRLLAGHERDAPGSALGLRMMGAVHRLVLEGLVPELAAFYPSAGGAGDPGRAAAPFLRVLEQRHDDLRGLLTRPVQTNEVWRSCALLGGFLTAAGETGLPLRLLDAGASAGLNLRFDRYFYSANGASWGVPGSPVRFENAFTGDRTPPLDVTTEVAERRGCDANPLDPTSSADRLTLMSYVWPDQRERFELLRAALELAPATPVAVERADAADWVERMLAARSPGRVTVIFHSIVRQYLAPPVRERFLAAIAEAGRLATADAPLAWLRMEPAEKMAEVRLNLWPGGEERLLATCGYQRGPIRWRG
jgi:hypothetical protein